MLPARRAADAVGWLVRAISEAWDLRAEADAIRHARTRSQRERARALEAARLEREHDQRLGGWAAAISDALTDHQLADAVERVAQPIEWLGRRSAPLATTQLLAWAIDTAARAPEQPLDVVLDHALRASIPTMTALPENVPTPPPHVSTLTTADDLRMRVKRAVNVVDTPTPPANSSRKASAMTDRQPYAPDVTAAPTAGCNSTNGRRHRVALCECAGPPWVVAGCAATPR